VEHHLVREDPGTGLEHLEETQLEQVVYTLDEIVVAVALGGEVRGRPCGQTLGQVQVGQDDRTRALVALAALPDVALFLRSGVGAYQPVLVEVALEYGVGALDNDDELSPGPAL
jgi:hypothetical protein